MVFLPPSLLKLGYFVGTDTALLYRIQDRFVQIQTENPIMGPGRVLIFRDDFFSHTTQVEFFTALYLSNDAFDQILCAHE